MLSLLPDIFTIIENLLCPVDYNSLRFTCKDLNKLEKPNYKNIIKQKLRNHIEDPDDFLNNLSKCNAVISGSFILSCLYDNIDYNNIDIFEYIPEYENIDYDNIDIFEYIPEYENFNFDCSGSYKTTKNNFRRYLYNKFGDETNCHNLGYDRIKYRNREYKDIFNHICTPIDSLLYIKRSFELDICKNSFNGNNLYIKDWNKLIERRDYIRPSEYTMVFIGGRYYNKYLCKSRMQKYENKGFKINRHPKHDKMIKYMNSLAKNKRLGSNSLKNLLDYVADGTLDLESFD